MKVRALTALLVFLSVVMFFCSTIYAMDEAVLTPTSSRIVPEEEKEFNRAMGVWFKHRYADGEKMLREFSRKYPESRWAAEADLHVGCYLTFKNKYPEAKAVFDSILSKYSDDCVRTKAMLRLGNIAERTGKWDEAIQHYSRALHQNPTWDQFRYANYRARKLLMTQKHLTALTNCGPVALAACLKSLGKETEAERVRKIEPGLDGVSMAMLASEASGSGVIAQPVQMSLEELKTASYPVLAYIDPRHFAAVLDVKDGKAKLEDSIRGIYEIPLEMLAKIWTSKVLVFSQDSKLKPLSMASLGDIVGGCCGQADEDECLGSCMSDCQQATVLGALGRSSGGSSGGCAGCTNYNLAAPDDGRWMLGNIPSPGKPSWEINVINLNLLVTDTPIWYDPGSGPKIAFTLTYSNENSNTGIFGRGWRSAYDMKVFFLPNIDDDVTHPTLQVHRHDSKIETYLWDNTKNVYVPNNNRGSYGYRDTIEKLADGTAVLQLRGGGKYRFKPEGDVCEGRIWKIEDSTGKQVVCNYLDGKLAQVIDANGRVTTITTTGEGINERVTRITLPQDQTYPDGRYAEFGYDDSGNLISITDMAGVTSLLDYNSLKEEGNLTSAATYLLQNVTSTDPQNGGALYVDSTFGFAPYGYVKLAGNKAEIIAYGSKTSNSFCDITRGNPAEEFSRLDIVSYLDTTTLTQTEVTADPLEPANNGMLAVDDVDDFPAYGSVVLHGFDPVTLQPLEEVIHYTGVQRGSGTDYFTGITRSLTPCRASEHSAVTMLPVIAPYLSSITTPVSKTEFTYEWWVGKMDSVLPVVGIHEVYEYGAEEDKPAVPTMHVSWCSRDPYHTFITRYPSSVNPSLSTCADESTGHWTGGQTVKYFWGNLLLTIGSVTDPLGNNVLSYNYGDNRRIADVITPDVDEDGQNNVTQYTYDNYKVLSRTDPLNNTWTYTWENDRLKTVTDPYNRLINSYNYDPLGHITRVESATGTEMISHYDSYGRLDYTVDGTGNRTYYHYNENGETRGFLTSVTDSEGKTTRFTYDSKGRLHTSTDPNLNTITNDYDDLDRVTKVTNSDGTFVQTNYSCCLVESTVDENGKVTVFKYDSKSRPWVVIADAVSVTLGQAVDETTTGSITLSSTAGLPSVGTVFVEDTATGRSEIMTYTGVSGNTLTGFQRGRFGTTNGVFPAGSIVTEGVMVRTVYDPGATGRPPFLHRVIGAYDGREKYTGYTYRLDDLLERVDYPDGRWESFTYGPAGNVKTKTEGSSAGTKITNYQYDANGRVIKVSEGP